MIAKKYFLIILLAFFYILPSRAIDEVKEEGVARAWPQMQYADSEGIKYQLVCLKNVKEDPFVDFVTSLFSTKDVFKLYENGEPYTKERAKRLWNRVYPRTVEWFKGHNEFIPWTVIQQITDRDEPVTFVGILGAHLHTNEMAKEYKGVEICCAVDPKFWRKGVMSNACRVYFQTFSQQLRDLGERFNRIFAPISPVNPLSLNLAFKLGFEIGAKDSPDKPYVSGYFPNLKLEEAEKERLLGEAFYIAQTMKEGKIDLVSQLAQSDMEKLKAFRVVVVMSKEALFRKLLETK